MPSLVSVNAKTMATRSIYNPQARLNIAIPTARSHLRRTLVSMVLISLSSKNWKRSRGRKVPRKSLKLRSNSRVIQIAYVVPPSRSIWTSRRRSYQTRGQSPCSRDCLCKAKSRRVIESFREKGKPRRRCRPRNFCVRNNRRGRYTQNTTKNWSRLCRINKMGQNTANRF